MYLCRTKVWSTETVSCTIFWWCRSLSILFDGQADSSLSICGKYYSLELHWAETMCWIMVVSATLAVLMLCDHWPLKFEDWCYLMCIRWIDFAGTNPFLTCALLVRDLSSWAALFRTVRSLIHTFMLFGVLQASPTSVHYNAKGYEMLASVVAQGFTQLLSQGRSHRGHETDENVHDHPNPAERSQREREEFGRQQARQPPRAHHLSAGTVCSGGNTACPVNTTCIKDSYSDTGFGCCYLRSMVDCKDNWHCCPQGMQCGSCSLHGCMCLSPWALWQSASIGSHL